MFLHWFVSILSPLPLIPSLNVRLFDIIHIYMNIPHTHTHYEMNDDDESGRGGRAANKCMVCL